MDKEKFFKILHFNKSHMNQIQDSCQKFYCHIGRQNATVISDIQLVAEMVLNNNGFQFLRIPLKSKEIGAFQLRLNDASYLVLNTSKSLANNNFALVHELYHVLVQDGNKGNSAEVYLNHYDENENEMLANAFAGTILMPMEDFQLIAGLIKKSFRDIVIQKELYDRELCMIYVFMYYYKTTYMSVVIRCYELNVFDVNDEQLMEFLLDNNIEDAQRMFCKVHAEIKGTVSIMEPTFVDDFEKLYENAKRIGQKHVESGMITEEDLKYRLCGMRDAYEEVKGECLCR